MGSTIRNTLCFVVVAALVGGTTGVAQGRTTSPNSPTGCLATHHGAVEFCAAREHRHALRVIRHQQVREVARTHAKFKRSYYRGWNLWRLYQANRWERSRLKTLRKLPSWPVLHLTPQFTCIHQHEGAWNDSGDPYWGGLQMDRSFMATYGSDMIRKYHGFANVWSPRDQLIVAERAYYSGRGFGPWPQTRRMCGV